MSNIVTNNIDQGYPVSAQDNSSQGFRNNFTNIVSALATARNEVTDLETKTTPGSAPLTPLGVNGDKAGMVRADLTYVYFCHTDWTTLGGDQIWVRTAIVDPVSANSWA